MVYGGSNIFGLLYISAKQSKGKEFVYVNAFTKTIINNVFFLAVS